MIAKTIAIPLRIFPFSRTSHIVAWLTPDYGKVTTIIKGARRPKSAFLGQYDLGMRCELLFYRRERDGLHYIRECMPLDWRGDLRVGWRRAVAAAYLCELTNQTTVPMDESQQIFELLDTTLAFLTKGFCAASTIISFEFAMLAFLGLAPDFTQCEICAAQPHTTHWRFSLAAGKLRCPHVNERQPGETTVSLSKALLAELRSWQLQANTGTAPHSPKTPEMIAMRRFIGMFMQYHLDVFPASRAAAFAWLDANTRRD